STTSAAKKPAPAGLAGGPGAAAGDAANAAGIATDGAGAEDAFAGLVVPERYQAMLAQLPEQERVLLDKYSRTKKVVLRVPAKAHADAALRAQKALLEERKRRGSGYNESESNLVKRPRISAYQTEGESRAQLAAEA